MSVLFKAVLLLEFLFQGYCQYIYLSAVMQRKNTAWVTVGLFLTGSCLEFFVYITIYNPYINAILIPIISFILCIICYKAHIGTKLLHSIMVPGIFLISEMSILPLVNLIMNDNYLLTHKNTSELIHSTLSKIIFFIICMLIKQIAEKEIIKSKSIYLFVVPFFTIIIYYSMFFSLTKGNDANADDLSLLIVTVALIAINSVVFAIHESYVRTSQETAKLTLMEQKNQLNFEHYKVLSENYKNTKILVHDFKNHVNILKAIAKDGKQDKIIKYLDSLSSQEYFVSGELISGNKILDIILYQFSEKCREKGIIFKVVHNNINFSFVDESDLCGLLTNLFNNAVESAEKSKEKKVLIEFYKKEDLYFIDISNSCDEPPVISGGIPITSRNDKDNHGIGTISARKTARKYNGDITFIYVPEKHTFKTYVNLCNKSDCNRA